MARKYTKPYVGLKPIGDGKREVFRSAITPTEQTHPQYTAVIGPFRTRRAADYMAHYGHLNPSCQCVADAERIAAIRAGQTELAQGYQRHLDRKSKS